MYHNHVLEQLEKDAERRQLSFDIQSKGMLFCCIRIQTSGQDG